MATQLDSLHVDLSLRGHQAAMTALGGFKSYLGGIKANIIALGAASGAGFSVMTIKLAADLEQSRLRLKRFVDTDFSGLQSGIDQLATRIPIAVSGLYDIASGAAQVGVEGTKNILAFTEVVGKLSSVSDMSFNETAKDLAKLHNVFNLKPTEANRTANVIAGMSAASAADPSELITLTRYLSGAASTIGMTMDQTIALSAALKDAGVSSEIAGTSFSKLILEMSEAPEKFALVNDMTESEFKKLRDKNPIQALLKSLKSIESEGDIDDRVAKARAMGVEGARQSGATLQLIKALELFSGHLEKAEKFGKEQTVLDKQFNQQAESTYSQLQKLGNSFVLFSGEFEKSSLNIIKPAAEGLAAALGGVKDILKQINDGGGPAPAPDQVLNPAGGNRGNVFRVGREAAVKLAQDKDAADKARLLADLQIAERERQAAANTLAAKHDDMALLQKNVERFAGAARLADPINPEKTDEAKAMMANLTELNKIKADAVVLEKQLADAKARIAHLNKSPDEQAKEEAMGFRAKQGGRKFAFDKMVDPVAFGQFEDAFRGLPKELAGTDAAKEMAAKFGAMAGADVKKQLTEDELTQLIQKRAGAIGNIAQQIAQEKTGRLFAKPTFQGADESWKRIQSGAMEGDPQTRILKENARLHKETTKAVEALKSAVDAGIAEIKDNVIMLVGG